MKPGTITLGNASLHIGYSQIVDPSQRGFAREITDFSVIDGHRGKGEGTLLLKDVCDEADNENLLLLIIADTVKLAQFYMRFGFKTIQEKPVILMCRSPKNTIQQD